MRKLARVVGMMVGVAALAGCASIKDHRGYLIDQGLVDAVQPGVDNMASVEKSLGRPTFISEFGQKDWYYVSVDTRQAAFTRPRSKSQTIYKVTFDAKGNVAAIEKSGMEHVVRLNPDKHRTPTLGRNRGFLEDLFGNIGTVGSGVGGTGGSAPAPGTGPNGS